MKGAQKVGKMKCGLREKSKEKMRSVPCPKTLGSIELLPQRFITASPDLKWQQTPDD